MQLAAVVVVAVLLTRCGGGGEPAPTAQTIFEGQAVQIFLREAYKTGWFHEGDPIEIASEPMLWEEALARAQEMGLSLYPTIPGTPPFRDGLPGWLMTAKGEFYETAGSGVTPAVGAPRRPAVAVAFVDRQGRITYSLRFTDVTPGPTTAP